MVRVPLIGETSEVKGEGNQAAAETQGEDATKGGKRRRRIDAVIINISASRP